MSHWQQVAEAFSRKSLEYDEFGTDHPNLTRMRGRVYAHLDAFLPPGARILELNAGTGTDAVYLARRGHRVLATDIAPGMLAVAKQKARDLGLEDRVAVQDCSFTDLDRLGGGPFDAVFSNFGGLNCLDDLQLVTRHLPRLLVPGGLVTWVVMPPVCPWEWLALLKGKPGVAFRRLRRGGVMAHVSGVRFRAHYFWPSQVTRALGPAFETLRLEGLSLFAPTADLKGVVQRHPRLYRALVWLDDRLTGLPLFRSCGDFFILSVRYRGE